MQRKQTIEHWNKITQWNKNKCNENTSKDFLRENEAEKCFTNVNTAEKFHRHGNVSHENALNGGVCATQFWVRATFHREDKVGNAYEKEM